MKESVNYVFKCVIPGCLHKSDIGGVELFVNTKNVVEKTADFIKRLPETLNGILVVEMANFH